MKQLEDFSRAMSPCAARTLLFSLITTQNGALCAPPPVEVAWWCRHEVSEG
jgi:hypothetical protein